ncbi:uncharacterized protein N7498_002114 [Penicillium cinerascens]|uniref:Uncharacterized protein n=1 Tax=Penicillium cinerascens TaxID=70096 RepID=A0A9W9N9I1_9EURO|nr:uncharacterized protein N7498_002114 [Penicillium cinerascens]KAJ5215707.1 hypothetical protein N7498_002114 [Penicillium cinerascens]
MARSIKCLLKECSCIFADNVHRVAQFTTSNSANDLYRSIGIVSINEQIGAGLQKFMSESLCGLSSVSIMASVGNIYLNFGLRAISIFPAWLIVRQVGRAFGDKKIGRETRALRDTSDNE